MGKKNDSHILYNSKTEESWLSAFYGSPFLAEPPHFSKEKPVLWPHVEAYFHAAKTKDRVKQEQIRKAASPFTAKKIGQTVDVVKNWDKIRDKVMLKASRLKFEQNLALHKLLIETSGRDLIHFTPWGDDHWGTEKGKGFDSGANTHGKIQMKLRKKFIEQETLEEE